MTATALSWPIPNVLLSNGCDADYFLRKSGYDTLHAAVRVIDRLLAVARSQSEPLAFDKRYELGRVVRDTLATMAPLTLKQEKELALTAPDEPVFIRGNSVALDQAMPHPIDDALRLPPAGGIVEVTVSREATIAFRDRGPGISTEAAAHIYEPFWRRDGPDNGSVLGLAIAQETAKRHGGRLVAANALDGAAVFPLEIPCTP